MAKILAIYGAQLPFDRLPIGALFVAGLHIFTRGIGDQISILVADYILSLFAKIDVESKVSPPIISAAANCVKPLARSSVLNLTSGLEHTKQTLTTQYFLFPMGIKAFKQEL